MQRQFLLSVFVFIDSSVVSALQKNVEFHLGCHTCCLSYFVLGGTVGRSTITWSPNFLGCVFTTFSQSWFSAASVSRARAPLIKRAGWKTQNEVIIFFEFDLRFVFTVTLSAAAVGNNFRRIFRSFSMGKRKQKSYRSQKIVDIV